MLSQVLLALLASITIANAGNPLLYKQLPLDELQPIQERQNQEIVNYRLPNNTRPESYYVQFTTNVHQGNFAFSGSVDITINVISSTTNITLHQRQLTTGTITLSNFNTPTVNVALAPTTYDPITDFLIISLAATEQPLVANSKYILRIPFSGTLRNDDAGFYRSSYVAADGSIRYLGTTQFESTDARHGFPCYDEPAMRANFTIAITHHSSYFAISNMPVATITPQPNSMTTTTFAPTPPTPTYLLAYVVSDFGFVGNTATPAAFQQKVYTKPSTVDGGAFGLQAGIDILIALENYFGNKFPLPKMDQVAVPDFAAGAMENWGLVTYREQYLLYYPNTSTYVDQRNIGTIIAHEYTHQWFGNLVTPKWWTYLWLNEGFATLYEYHSTNLVFPEWRLLDAFALTRQSVMQYDATTTTRPMTHYVESPNEISRLFDNVAYSKSGSVLHMFLHAFSEASFKKGLVNYQNKMGFSDATEEDLFDGIEAAVRQDNTLPATVNVAQIMLSWTRQAGFPVVHVTRNYTSGEITLLQERYFTTAPAEQSPSTWWIPYNFASASASDDRTFADRWIAAEQRSVVVSDAAIPSADWLIINKQQSGYYRVHYDNENYKLIADELVNGDFKKIHYMSRSYLIGDVFEFAYTNRLNYTIVFDIIKYLEKDTEYLPWTTTFTGLNNVERLFAGSSIYPEFAKFLIKLLTQLYSTTGVLDVEGEAHFYKQSRITAMNWACRLGYENCLRDANTLLKEHLTVGRVIHQNTLLPVYCNGIRNATEADYNTFWSKLRGETNAAERLRIISALTCKSDSVTLSNLLQASVATATTDLGFITNQERVRVFNDVAANGQLGATEATKFLTNNLDNANAQYGTNNLNNALANLGRYVVSDELRVEYNALLSSAALKTYVTAAATTNANNNLAANKRWTDRNQADIENWLLENGAASFSVPSMIITILLVVSRLF